MPKRKPGKGRITEKRVQATENDPPPKAPGDVALAFEPEPDDAPWDKEGLTPHQYRFVLAYIGPAGGNATKAAEIAGYRADNRNALAVTAWENLRKPNIKAAIARRLALENLTPEFVKGMTAALAASNMGTFLTLDDVGEPRIDWQRAEAIGAFVQIRKYKEKGLKSIGADGAAKVDVIERTIETHNPASYLNLLAKMLGLVNEDASGTTVNINLSKQAVDYDAIESELQRIVQRSSVGARVPTDN